MSFAMFSKPVRRWLRNERGGIAITYALSFTMLAGFTGLGIEVGDWYVTRHTMKNAADAAAFAVAIAGENSTDVDLLRTVAFQAARNAGFTGVADAIVVQRPEDAYTEHLPHIPPASGGPSLQEIVRSAGWQVMITQRKQLAFAALVGQGDGRSVTLRVVSVAGSGQIGDPAPRCLVGLETTDGVPAVQSNGAAFTLSDGCGIHSNSDMVVNGNNQSVAGRPISVTGDFISGAVTPSQLVTNARTYPDPFANMDAVNDFDPDEHACTHNNMQPIAQASADGLRRFAGGRWGAAAPTGSGAIHRVAQPSAPTSYDATTRADRTFVFCGSTDFRANTTFAGPALYLFKDSFDISGAAVSGTDVTFIFADMSPDDVRVTGNGALNLTAPRKEQVEALPSADRDIMEPWIGIALFGDEETFAGGTAFNLDTATFAGNFDLNIDGVVYTPGAGLDLRGNVTGNSNSCMRVVARQIEVSGSVELGGADCDDLFGDAVNDLVMLQPRLYY